MKASRVRFQLPDNSKQKLREKHLYPSFIAVPVQSKDKQGPPEAELKAAVCEGGNEIITIDLDDDSSSETSEKTEIYYDKKSSEAQSLPNPKIPSVAYSQGGQSNDALESLKEIFFRQSHPNQGKKKKDTMENVLRCKHRELQGRKNREYAQACRKILKIKESNLFNLDRHILQIKEFNKKRNAICEEMWNTLISGSGSVARFRKETLAQALHFLSSLQSEMMLDQKEIVKLSTVIRIEENDLQSLRSELETLQKKKMTFRNIPPREKKLRVSEEETCPNVAKRIDFLDFNVTEEDNLRQNSVTSKADERYSSIFM